MMHETDAASHVCVYLEALEHLGYDTDALITAVGLHRADIEDPDGRIPCSTLGALFQRAMQDRPLSNLGMRIAAETPIGAFPLIDYLVVTSETVGDGLKQLSRYFRLTGFPVFMSIREHEEPVRVMYEGPPGPFGFEFGTSLCLLHLREETENRFRPEYVSLAHEPDDVAEMERVLGCPVHKFGSWNGWAMSREMWQLPFRRRDPILRVLLERQANDMLNRLVPDSPATSEVRRVLISRVAGGDTSIQAVARALATSARSLQRQLATEGVSYRELLDMARKDAAKRYLAESSLPITEVSYLLGFSEPAAFHRAFKRWYRETPISFRRKRVLRGRTAS